MEACFEYLGCKKQDCPMFKQKNNKKCWEVEETLCNHHGIELVRKESVGNKENACLKSGCIYYKAASASVVSRVE
jgi:hypothetical protein